MRAQHAKWAALSCWSACHGAPRHVVMRTPSTWRAARRPTDASTHSDSHINLAREKTVCNIARSSARHKHGEALRDGTAQTRFELHPPQPPVYYQMLRRVRNACEHHTVHTTKKHQAKLRAVWSGLMRTSCGSRRLRLVMCRQETPIGSSAIEFNKANVRSCSTRCPRRDHCYKWQARRREEVY